MTQLLIVNATIVAIGPFESLEGKYKNADGEFSIETLDSNGTWSLVEKDLPANFELSKFKIDSNGNIVAIVPPVVPPTQEQIAEFINAVEEDVNAIIFATIGNKALEYKDAYNDALNFKTASYPANAVPQSVQDYAVIKGWNAQQAADDVITTGAFWTIAATAIRKNRLDVKEKARTAQSEAQFNEAKIQWEGFKAAIKQQLNIK